MTDLYIWISRWEEFQHYKPERDRGPAWIKSYTKQLEDSRYLRLTDRQRALLGDLRVMFALSHGQLLVDKRAITRRRNAHTLGSDLETLNHAGFIEFCSREDLERRLELLYSLSRRSKEVEVDKEVEKTPQAFSPLPPPTVVRPPARAEENGGRLDGAASADNDDPDNPGLTFDEWVSQKVER